MTGMELQELQELKKEVAAGLEELTEKEILRLSGLLDGLRMARNSAAENEKTA